MVLRHHEQFARTARPQTFTRTLRIVTTIRVMSPGYAELPEVFALEAVALAADYCVGALCEFSEHPAFRRPTMPW